MTVEQKTDQRRSRSERFRSLIETLKPAPVGMEYKRFYGQPVLFPATGDDPIRKGTGYTQRQLETALSLQRRIMGEPDLLTRFNQLRERRLRGELNEGVVE